MATELRERKGGEVPPPMMVAEDVQMDNMSKEEVMEIAEDSAPPFLLPYIAKVAPALAVLGTIIDVVGPHVENVAAAAVAFWAAIQPYHPEEFAVAGLGFIVCFFGSSFMVSIAAVEAFRLCGWETTRDCILSLYEDYKIVREAYRKDSLLDENNDGIADVDQITKKELASRKVRVILRACNPVKIQHAIAGINAGVIAVVATLKIHFAEAITLGTSIASTLVRASNKTLKPSLQRIVEPEYHKWIDPVIQYACQTIGISIAYTLHRIIATFHAAVKGGFLFTKGVLHYAERRGFAAASKVEEGSPAFTGMALAVAALGFYFQASSWFGGLPFPINILLLPFTIVEYILTWIVFN
ncbi:inframe stop codon [Thecamonas trahens ATCC 50062]|uniref:Inframe stop codon n=1 Tax=Thecamonas trahens ATCC 50062 TaxID=461836 RepID=A0A0L0DFB1_THETB|nr:inframe stop codon [Thecamonas trahens ATCC 50062]KNC50831.1 inframe stop codon [Thecamonas trahens ATCC 50062]|eukprot:XP_013756786.1 inframe stop codon [Thecamonas trahens ATCC 50062]